MKRLAPLLALMSISSAVLGYQPAGYFPAPYPYFAPPPYPVQPYAYPQPNAPKHMPPYGHVAPYPMFAYPPPVYQAPVAPAARVAEDKAQKEDLAVTEVQVKADSRPEKTAAETGTKSSRSASETQAAFLEMLRPIVERENARLRGLRIQVTALLAKLESNEASDADRKRLTKLAARYRVKGNVLVESRARIDLLSRIDTIPPALALAQAANESAWGTSRFAREGNNLFGIWTYDERKGIVPKNRPEGAKHLVRKFDSFDESVRYYLHTLNSHPAYQPLRDTRAAARERGDRATAIALAGGLEKYSAKGELYVRLIRQLINRYQLASLDNASEVGSG